MGREAQGWELQASIIRPGTPKLVETYHRSQISIGGLPDNTIVLSDPFVSGRHARVMVSDGKVIYQDCSRNGSFVDGKRIEKKELAAGEVVSIPPYELSFELVLTEEVRQTQARETYKVSLTPELQAMIEATSDLQVDRGQEATIATRAPGRASALLRVKQPSEWAGEQHALGQGLVRIGRSEGVQMQFDLPTLSRQHAAIHHDGERWWVEDEGSSNGTFLDGRRVARSRLAFGDEIGLGPDLVLELIESEELGPSARERRPEARKGTDVPVVEIEAERVRGAAFVLLLRIGGRVDGYNYTVFADHLDRAIDAGERFLIIDLSGLDFIDHTGLGALVNAATRLDRVRGHLRLVGVGPRLHDTFELSRLDSLFRGRIAGDIPSAVRALERLR